MKKKSLKKLDRVDQLEREIKQLRLQMLIRIKNEMTDAQHEKLTEVVNSKDSWSLSTGIQKEPNIVIKGLSEYGNKNKPNAIFIVDGIRQIGAPLDFEGMNPDNIESVNVIRGKSAEALFGKDGKNGVIIIKTKSGLKIKN